MVFQNPVIRSVIKCKNDKINPDERDARYTKYRRNRLNVQLINRLFNRLYYNSNTVNVILYIYILLRTRILLPNRRNRKMVTVEKY